MSKTDRLFSTDTVAELVGEEGVEELMAEFQRMVQCYMALDKPVVGEVISDNLRRQVHSLKSATQFVGAAQLAQSVIALDKAFKAAPLCCGEIESQLMQLEVQLLEIDQQLTDYLEQCSRANRSN